jgi:hypothetical protein
MTEPSANPNPSAKRAKTSSASEQFVSWLSAHGVQWDATQIDPIAAVAGGVGVRALKDIAVGDVLATIAKAGGSLISPQTSLAKSALQQRQLEGGLAATVAVWIEMHHAAAVPGNAGADSPFAAYFKWERPGEDVPVRWPAEARLWLRGTDAELLHEQDEALLREDFDEQAWPTLELATSPAYCATLDKLAEFVRFVAAGSLVASRAFGVDGHHGDALVPFAALFNHSTTQPHIHVQDAPLEGEDDDDDDDDAASSDLETPSRVTHMQIVAVRAAAAGDELLNTYGYHLTNRKLLHSYGFCQVRKIDEHLHRTATVQLLREADEKTTDFHFWAKIARIFPNNVVSLPASLVRDAITDAADQALVEHMTKAFVVIASPDDDGGDEDNEDEDDEVKPGKKGGEGGGDGDVAEVLPLGLIAPAEPSANNDDDDESFDGPDSYDVHAFFVGNAVAVGLDFKLILLLRLLDFDADARTAVVNDGLPAELLQEVDCVGAITGSDDDDDDGGVAHHPSDEHDATYEQLQQAPLLKHCNLGPKARQVLQRVTEARLARYASHGSLSADCHALGAVLDAAEPKLGRQEFALMLRIGERSLLRLMLARLDLLSKELN